MLKYGFLIGTFGLLVLLDSGGGSGLCWPEESKGTRSSEKNNSASTTVLLHFEGFTKSKSGAT